MARRQDFTIQHPQRLDPNKVHEIRVAVLDMRAEGVRPTSREVARRTGFAEATCRKYLKQALADIEALQASTSQEADEAALAVLARNTPDTPRRKNGGPKAQKMKRDLLRTLEQTVDNYAEAALMTSRNVLAAARAGGRLDLSAVQLQTALGISLDKLTLYRREEQAQLWQQVLSTDNEASLDAKLQQLDAELARLESAGMVTR